MNNNKLFIPTLCKVGFQARLDTYTQRLGYVIAFDGKKWRKEPSWKGWCQLYKTEEQVDTELETLYQIELRNTETSCRRYYAANKLKVQENPKILKQHGWKEFLETSEEDYVAQGLKGVNKGNLKHRLGKYSLDESFKPIEFENVPTSGFTLNKDVRRDGYWGNGHNMIRVYDPRGFEFEISVINLLFILMYVDCNSRELMGEMVYAWNGKDLVLLPANTEEYQNSLEHTSNQYKKVSAKEIVPGIYKTKQGVLVKYLGKFRIYENNNYNKTCTILEKQHVFVLPEETYRKSWGLGKSIYQYGTSLSFLSHYISENDSHAEDVEMFLASKLNYQVDYSKPIYVTQNNLVPFLNYGFSIGLKKDFRLAEKINPHTYHNYSKVTDEGLIFENVYTSQFPKNQNDPTSYYYSYGNGVEFNCGGYDVFYNDYKFEKAVIKQGQVFLWKNRDYRSNNYDHKIDVNHNEFIHNIVIKKLVGYETTNGIHYV